MVRSSSALSEVWARRSIGALFGIFLAASSALPQNNLDVCRVTTDTWSVSGGYGTGIYEIGKFPVEDIEDGAKKSFRYETGSQLFIIDVEIEYGDTRDVEKGKPTRIMLSLLARRVEDEKNKSIRPVEAETDYRHKWGTVKLASQVVKNDVAQRFQLICSDGISKNGVQRGDPTWLKRLKERRQT